MDVLKQYLSEALQQAKGRPIGIFGYGAFGAVTYCAMEALNVEPVCFYDMDPERINGTFFGKPIKGLWECLGDSSFIFDVFNDPQPMKSFAEKNNLTEQLHYSSLHGLFGYKKCDTVDPLLIYNRIDDCIGFTYFDKYRTTENPYKIVTLGGSTSDCTFGSIKSWPEYLHTILSEHNVDNMVISGGTVGYTSAQERDKFLRDVIQMKPDMVVSLSGDNDIGWSHCDPENNYYANYLKYQIVEPIYSHCLEKNETIAYGINENMSAAERWYRNHRLIHFVSSEFGISHICFLQPCILADAYRMSSFESDWISILKTKGMTQHNTVTRLFEGYSGFYREVLELIKSADCFTDITDCFTSYSGVYIDGIHYCEEGNKIIARRIADEILKVRIKDHG